MKAADEERKCGKGTEEEEKGDALESRREEWIRDRE